SRDNARAASRRRRRRCGRDTAPSSAGGSTAPASRPCPRRRCARRRRWRRSTSAASPVAPPERVVEHQVVVALRVVAHAREEPAAEADAEDGEGDHRNDLLPEPWYQPVPGQLPDEADEGERDEVLPAQ